MFVAELIEQLKLLPPNAVIYLQEDDEGNGYHHAHGAEIAYTEETGYSIDWAHSPEIMEMEELDPEEHREIVVVY